MGGGGLDTGIASASASASAQGSTPTPTTSSSSSSSSSPSAAPLPSPRLQHHHHHENSGPASAGRTTVTVAHFKNSPNSPFVVTLDGQRMLDEEEDEGPATHLSSQSQPNSQPQRSHLSQSGQRSHLPSQTVYHQNGSRRQPIAAISDSVRSSLVHSATPTAMSTDAGSLLQRSSPASASAGTTASASASAGASTSPAPASTHAATRGELLGGAGYGIMGTLLWSQREQSVVRNRQGSVLARGLVLKTDHFAGARPTHLDLHLQGAPNFRKADCPLEVYGVAQPTVTGLKTILSVLRSQPVRERSNSSNGRRGSGIASPNALSPRLDATFDPSFSGGLSPPARAESPLSAGRAGPATPAGVTGGTGDAASQHRCVWVCTREEPVVYVGGRPFVLREAGRPTETFGLSGRADSLEGIELRLKQDILREAARYGGLLMVHEESSNGDITPTWIAVDADTVQTVREVWERVRSEGWRVDYHRIPVAEDQAMENNYLDAYTQVIKDIDPTRTSLVANCGVGFVRTTFAMVAAVIVRRKQMLLLGHEDPFQLSPTSQALSRQTSPSTPASGVAKSIQQASEQHSQNKSLLRLIHVLGESLSSKDSKSAIELLLSQPALLDSLRSANMGDYGIIRQLAGLLDEGLENKAVVDAAIDSCAHVTNLREAILLERVRYSTQAMDDNRSGDHLQRAVKALEKYVFLVAFASYVNASKTATFQHRFADWLKGRAEIWHTIVRIRSKGRQLYFFDPVADLSLISRGAAGSLPAANERERKHFGEVSVQGGQLPGDEFAEYVVRNRAGIVLRPFTLLKSDIWRQFIERNAGLPVRGTVNFRRIPGSNIFATGQPTVEGISNVLRTVYEQYSGERSFSDETITWLNLREEPLVYVNGKPYCLRQKSMSLRNIKAYSGISWARLALLEDRLKNDVIAELETGEDRLLLHTETADGTVVPVWEEAQPKDVETIQEVMDNAAAEVQGAKLIYRRIPITAEKPPDFSDISELLTTVLRANVDRQPIVLNCQLGRGRSTLSAVLVLLISRWLDQHGPAHRERRQTETGNATPQAKTERSEPLNYHVINSLLRVIPKGLEVKKVVDECIERCSSITNLRDAIEEARLAAEDTENENVRRQKVQSGCHNLRRYFVLIVFQAYLSSTMPDTLDAQPTFEAFVKRQPVFETISKDLDNVDISTIMPLQKVDARDGMALSDEVQEVVSHRSGSILSAYTMLKSDFFSGIVKLSLPDKIPGIPNLRGVPLLLGQPPNAPSAPRNPLSTSGRETWGSGMPTVEGLRRGLARMGAAPDGPSRVVWTSLREEPVLYVNGRPHVLRLADKPLTNVEATGVTTDVVEGMEVALKADVLAEAKLRDGRVLLHDEVEVQRGQFDIIPVWETVKDGDVLTPKEVYSMIQREGYKVDYARVAITDEQAPVPAVFTQLEARVKEALRTGSSSVFNCQMGRGRTTTGMVIAALVSTVSHLGEELFSSEMSASFTSSMEDNEIENAKDSLDNREDDLWLQGEYRIILQIVGVLSHGKLAKKLTDRAIDRMEAVQNLRKAIYDSKLRADNADRGTKKHRHLFTVAWNYLQRYGYLIVFANYLLDKAQASLDTAEDREDSSPASASRSSQFETNHEFPTFLNWLQPRREISSILSKRSLD